MRSSITERGEFLIQRYHRAKSLPPSECTLPSVTRKLELTKLGSGRSFNLLRRLIAHRARKHEGIGLGPAISKQLMKLMDRLIGVGSTLGEGSTFWFNI